MRDRVEPREVKLNISYEDYIESAILWATEDIRDLAKALDVKKVVAQGSYIRGLFGGEKKSGAERYAGLVVNDLRSTGDGFYIRLFNTDKEYMMPLGLMRRHSIDIYKMYYVGSINPFKCFTHNVVLSTDEDKLKKFIEEVIRLNENTMTEADEKRLRKLSEELKAQVKVLDSRSHYVIYRSNGVFSACAPEDLSSKTTSESNIAYVECKSVEQAYYYTAVLNYMAYKAVDRGGFLRHQFTKPILAIVTAGLAWGDVPIQLRGEIAKLSYELSSKLKWVDYSNQRKAIIETAKRPEFERIIELLDRHIEETSGQSMLEKVLDLVTLRR